MSSDIHGKCDTQYRATPSALVPVFEMQRSRDGFSGAVIWRSSQPIACLDLNKTKNWAVFVVQCLYCVNIEAPSPCLRNFLRVGAVA